MNKGFLYKFFSLLAMTIAALVPLLFIFGFFLLAYADDPKYMTAEGRRRYEAERKGRLVPTTTQL